MSSKYFCTKCNQIFTQTADVSLLTCKCKTIPIIDRIPRFVHGDSYASAFGLQWNRFRNTQLDSFSGLTISEDRLRRCLSPLELSSLSGKRILEIGCGAGRFTEILIHCGASVVSVDLSNAVDANAENFPISDVHSVIQADASDLPFDDGTFDVVLCLGVMQHTGDPDAVLKSMLRLTKNSGCIVFDHYRITLSFVSRMLPLYRFALKFARPKSTLEIAEKLVKILLPIHRLLGRTYITYALLSRLSPIVSYFHCYSSLSLAQQRQWAILDTHDSLFDYYKRLHSPRSLARWLSKLGITAQRISKGGIGLEILIIK
jgi:2-polyprenyl-3-methyl-5-hydroxy-6-metoxy-1,4-benzoquinol methylase